MAEETATGTQTTTETTATETVDTIDYKALYESMSAENTKLKGLNDKYCKEIGDYKKGEKAKMSEEELRTQELEDAKSANAELSAKLAKIESEKTFADGGFKSEEYSPIIDSMVEMGVCTPENSKTISDTLMGIINKRVEAEKDLYKNSITAQNTIKPSTESTAEELSDYQMYQKSRAEKALKPKIEL